jgi:G3E family GTPase
MNLAGGCVCCDTKEDLSWGIAQLVRDYESDVIILECSGMADPAEVIDGVTDLYTARLTHLEKVIALLHPIPTDRESMGGFVTRQAIRCADELILNKKDLYIAGHWERFTAAIVEQNPYARVWETSHARVDSASLLEPITRMSSTPTAAVNVEFGVQRSSATNKRASYHPIATTVRLPGPLNFERFLRWMKTLPPDLERAKGFFRFAKGPELQEFQYAPPGNATITPITLLDEPSHAIVLIGRGYDQERCQTELLGCLESYESTGG